MIKLISFALVAVLSYALTAPITKGDTYDVIIIGAGIAGLGASKKLSDHGIRHLILEARDRVGGRINSQTFEGLEVEMGANALHSQSNDALNILMNDMGWTLKEVESPNQHFLYESSGELSTATLLKAGEIHQKIMQKVVHNAFTSDTDLSFKKASENELHTFVGSQNNEVQNTVKWLTQIQGNMQGANLYQLSARQTDIMDGTKEFVPQRGLQSFVTNLYQQTQGVVQMSEAVSKIVYNNQSRMLRVYTIKNKLYRAPHIFVSAPLGVLKSGAIQFDPPLPTTHTKALDKLGVGNMNKVYVSFRYRFWGDKTGWLNFVTKDITSNLFPMASIIPASTSGHILCFYVSGKSNSLLKGYTPSQIAAEVTKSMQKFFKSQPIQVLNVKMTSWDTNPFSLGAYSYYKVGTTMQDIIELRRPIEEKIWFIGEHTHPRYASTTHGAYQTGQWAAEEVLALRQNAEQNVEV